MKAVLAAIGGFVGGGALLGCGAVLAVHMMTTKPNGSLAPGSAMAEEAPAIATAAAAPAKPRTEDFERISPRPPTESQLSLARNAVPNGGNTEGDGVDLMQTAALPAGSSSTGNAQAEEQGLADPEQEKLLAAHVDWCANRYRSYRPRDNSYTPYSGGRSVCVSPYAKQLSAGMSASVPADAGVSAPPAAADSFGEEEAAYQQVSVRGGGVVADNAAYSPNHIAYCFGRYRSYDPADNSYQPYGGGPRQQCVGD